MSNPRMRTKAKPLDEKKLPLYVKNIVEGVIAPHETSRISGTALKIPFEAVIEWEERPRVHHPHWTKITFHGCKRFEQAFAHYRGMYGEWYVDLAAWNGPFCSIEEAMKKPCTRTWGTPVCVTPSDEWRETQTQRRERIAAWMKEGVL